MSQSNNRGAYHGTAAASSGERGRGTRSHSRARGRGRGRGSFLTNPNPNLGHTPNRVNAPMVEFEGSSRTQTEPETDPVSMSAATAMQRRRMNLMASVSRSSGLEKDGDDLKSHRTQVEYRAFIQEKVDHLFKTYSHTASETERAKKHRFDAQENILILFRKLREGVASSKRNDDFALEVYETSLYLSTLFEAPKQTTSIIPHLFPPQHEPSDSQTKLPRPPSMSCVLISLLHHLVTSYPSQSQYFQQLDAIPKDQLSGTGKAAVWLKSLAKSVRTRNYATFADLSNKVSLLAVLLPEKDKVPASQGTAASWKSDPDLGLKAALLLTETLRNKVADTTWNVIRASYRELNQNSLKTTSWLSRSLCLESIYDSSFDITADGWLVTKAAPEGHVRRKEGVEGRWIVCKVR